MAEGSVGILFDENFSPKLVSILRHLGVKGLAMVASQYGAGLRDEEWIPMAAERRFVTITQDRRQLSDETIAPILRCVGARVIYLPHRFANSGKWDQALWLLKHWKRIADEARCLNAGDLRKVQWNGVIRRL